MSSESGSAARELPDPPIEPVLDGEGVHPVRRVLPGLEAREVFQDIAGSFDAERLIDEAHILCFRGDGYPRVDDHTAHILCPDRYLSAHEPLIVYLDIVHEMVHVRQVLDGKQVYHFPKPYVTWPTEIEAYRITYVEAQRLGVPDDWFWQYLAVPWAEHDDLVALARSIGMPHDLAAYEGPDEVDAGRL